MQKVNSMTFTIKDSFFIKGIAIFLMLVHHIFLSPSIYHEYDIVDVSLGNMHLFHILSGFSKVCVSMFVFLTGYGLVKSCERQNRKTIKFYFESYFKLMQTFWFVFLIFIPLSYFAGRTINTVYENHHFAYFALQFLGLQQIFGFYGFNPTWWYMSAAICLYFIFPMTYPLVKRFPVLIFVALIILLFVYQSKYNPVTIILPFTAGIFLSYKSRLEFILSQRYLKYRIMMYCIILPILIVFRYYDWKNGIGGVYYDTLFSIILIMLAMDSIANIHFMYVGFSELGVHSYNIFLTHTFYFFFFKDQVYALKYPIIIVTCFTVFSYLVSLILEYIKKVSKYNYYFKKNITDRFEKISFLN